MRNSEKNIFGGIQWIFGGIQWIFGARTVDPNWIKKKSRLATIV
jgi:hypothetical protein